MKRVDRAGQWLVDRFASLVSWVCLTVALAWIRVRRLNERIVLPGPQMIDGVRTFVCGWCGSRTPEAQEFPLTCCWASWRAYQIEQDMRKKRAVEGLRTGKAADPQGIHRRAR